jgi:hypothetical protein
MRFGRVWLKKRRKEMRPFLDMHRERLFGSCSVNNILIIFY